MALLHVLLLYSLVCFAQKANPGLFLAVPPSLPLLPSICKSTTTDPNAPGNTQSHKHKHNPLVQQFDPGSQSGWRRRAATSGGAPAVVHGDVFMSRYGNKTHTSPMLLVVLVANRVMLLWPSPAHDVRSRMYPPLFLKFIYWQPVCGHTLTRECLCGGSRRGHVRDVSSATLGTYAMTNPVTTRRGSPRASLPRPPCTSLGPSRTWDATVP